MAAGPPDRPCPLCASGEVRELYRHRGRIVECEVCGLVRRDPIPHEVDLLAVYRSAEYFRLARTGGIGYGDYYADEPVYRSYFRRKMRTLARFRAPPGHLLEIGAAAGYALDEARRIGWTVRGLEVSPSAARHAAGRLGLDVREGGFTELDEAEEYDVVLCFQTLEHVSDVRAAIRRIRRALRPQGVLMLTTPDHRSWVRRVLRRWWPSYRPEHLVYFDRRTLRRFLEEEGFTVELMAADGPLWVPIPRLAERASHYYGAGWLRRAPAPGWRLPVWLGDMVVVAALGPGPRARTGTAIR